ncbi:MAG TPA: molybdopterin converting factor subunit 1 [Labilithrix sp.]|jgi:molybdopterin converting factor subunit 1
MIKIHVLYFAAVRDLAGIDAETITLPDEVRTIDALCTHLQKSRPAFEGRLGYVRFARNEEFAKGGDAIADGDVIALIPPVAGG